MFQFPAVRQTIAIAIRVFRRGPALGALAATPIRCPCNRMSPGHDARLRLAVAWLIIVRQIHVAGSHQANARRGPSNGGRPKNGNAVLGCARECGAVLKLSQKRMDAHLPPGRQSIPIRIRLRIIRHARIELVQIAPLHLVRINQPIVVGIVMTGRCPKGIVLDGLVRKTSGIGVLVAVQIFLGGGRAFPPPNAAIPAIVLLRVGQAITIHIHVRRLIRIRRAVIAGIQPHIRLPRIPHAVAVAVVAARIGAQFPLPIIGNAIAIRIQHGQRRPVQTRRAMRRIPGIPDINAVQYGRPSKPLLFVSQSIVVGIVIGLPIGDPGFRAIGIHRIPAVGGGKILIGRAAGGVLCQRARRHHRQADQCQNKNKPTVGLLHGALLVMSNCSRGESKQIGRNHGNSSAAAAAASAAFFWRMS